MRMESSEPDNGADASAFSINRAARLAERFVCRPERPGQGVDLDFTRIEHFKAERIMGAYLSAARPGWFSTKSAY